MAGEREERKRRSEERQQRRRKKAVVTASVMLGLLLLASAFLFGLVFLYEKPASPLAVTVPEAEGLAFSGWKAEARQQYRKGTKHTRQYLDAWTVTAAGRVENTGLDRVLLGEVCMEVLDRGGEVRGADRTFRVSLGPGEGRTLHFSADASDAPPARVRLTLSDRAPPEDLADMAEKIRGMQQKLREAAGDR